MGIQERFRSLSLIVNVVLQPDKNGSLPLGLESKEDAKLKKNRSQSRLRGLPEAIYKGKDRKAFKKTLKVGHSLDPPQRKLVSQVIGLLFS